MSAIEYQPRVRVAMAIAAVAAMSLLHAPARAQSGKNRVRALAHETTASAAGEAPPGTTTIRIRGTATPTFTVYKLERPERVVIDLANAALDPKLSGRDASADWPVNSWSVSSVAGHAVAGSDRSTVRFIVHLARSASYQVDAKGRDLVVVITPHEPALDSRGNPALERELADTRARVTAAEKAAREARAEAEKARAEAAKAEKKTRTGESEIAAAQRAVKEREAALRAAEDKHRDELRRAAERETELRQQAAREAERREQAEEQARESRRQAERESVLRKQAEERAAKSRELAERTMREAEEARENAAARVREAEERMKEASAMMQTADKRLASAEKAEREARQAESDAEKARQQVSERRRAAAEAERLAAERLAEAERAQKAARTYLSQASDARGDEEKARSLRERAEKAAREAEERRIRAEKAAKAAEATRLEAEKAASTAGERLRESVAALERARKERADAEAARRQADSQRQAAEAARTRAEELRVEAEAAAREASERAERARSLRQAEEVAYAKILEAKQRAEEGRRASDAASKRLASAERAAGDAKAHLDQVRKETEDVSRRLAELSKKTHTSQSQVRALERQAKELAEERTLAERELSARRAEVERSRGELGQLEQALAKKTAELSAVEDAAARAKSAREREERLLAQLSERRAEAERALQEAESKRTQLLQQQAAATHVARARSGGPRKRSKTASTAKPTKPTKPTKTANNAKRSPKAKTAERDADGKRGAAAARVVIRALEFVDQQRVSRVELSLSGPAKPRLVTPSGRRVVLEVPDSELPGELERTLDTTRFHGPIKAVSSYRDPRDPSTVRVVVDLTRPVDSKLARDGTTWRWEFAKNRAEMAAAKTAAGTRVADKPARSKRSAPAPARGSAPAGGFGATSTPITQQSIAQLDERRRKVYRGTKMDLDFKDADIHNLLRTLANVGGVNIVIPDEIQARVTVRLRRVPWDQALEVILASKGLWYKREGDLYRIATRKQLDAEAEAEAARLAALVKAEAPEPQIFTLNYAVADKVKGQLEPLLSPKGRIEVDARTNSLIINDIRANRRRIIDLLTRLDTQTPQVQIEARIVEARSDFAREIGIQWGGNANVGDLATTGLVVRGGNDSPGAGGIAPAPSDFAVNVPAGVEPGQGGAIGLALGALDGSLNLTLRLSALEDTGSVRIISAPKITVLDNVEAEMSQGVSIPISVISANGVQTQFVDANLSLKVTPHVSQRDCSVQMELHVAKNEADFVNVGARGDPTILRKEAKTTILVADGETTVIGGIYTRNTGVSYSKIPFLGDLPVFGWLFKNRRENDNRSEVLVFITPKITNKGFLRCE